VSGAARRGRWPLAALLLAWAGAGRAGDDRPLGLSTGGAFGGLFLEPTLADARAPRGAELALSWTLANDWGAPTGFLSAGRRVLVRADEQTDAIGARLRLPWARLLGPGPAAGDRGLWERLSTGVEARLLTHWGGWTDRPIETWHHGIRSTNFLRARFARDEVRVEAYDLDTGRGLRLRSPRLALGDLVLRTQILAAEGGVSPLGPDRSRWGLSARIDVKAPLGRPERLGGSGGWDAAAALLGTVEAVRGLTLHALAALTLTSPLPPSIPLQVQLLRPFAELSLALRLGTWTVLLEDRLSGPILRRLVPMPDVPGAQVEASAYYGLALPQNRVAVGLRRGSLTLWFSEDWTPGAGPRAQGALSWFYNTNAPDIALGLVWTHGLGP